MEEETSKGHTAMFLACWRGHLDVAQRLHAAGASPIRSDYEVPLILCVCMCMCMCVCVCITCMHACMYVCYVHVCMYACMYVYTYVCMLVCMYACMHHVRIGMPLLRSQYSTHAHTRTHTRTHTHTHTLQGKTMLDRAGEWNQTRVVAWLQV